MEAISRTLFPHYKTDEGIAVEEQHSNIIFVHLMSHS